jgi:hypothetical protein
MAWVWASSPQAIELRLAAWTVVRRFPQAMVMKNQQFTM